jgi:hypothetical protein
LEIEVSWFPPGKLMIEPEAEGTYPIEIQGDFHQALDSFPEMVELVENYEWE